MQQEIKIENGDKNDNCKVLSRMISVSKEYVPNTTLCRTERTPDGEWETRTDATSWTELFEGTKEECFRFIEVIKDNK